MPWDTVPRSRELWTRSILLNEVLFDADARPWSRVAHATSSLLSALDSLAAPYYSGPSGGKGTHTSVFLDPASVKVDAALLDRAERLGVDAWSEARAAFAHLVFDAMGLPRGDDVRWAPPLGASGVWDRSKIRWSAGRSGSMVRVLGTPGGDGTRRKTLWDADACAATAGNDSPPSMPVSFHSTPTLYAAPAELNAVIVANIEAACLAVEAARAKDRPALDPEQALSAFKAVPCIARTLSQPCLSGTRHYAFLNLAVMAKHFGVAREDAQGLLQEALAVSGLPATDKAVDTLGEVYDGRYSLVNVACPSPHVRSFCQPNACSQSRRFTF